MSALNVLTVGDLTNVQKEFLGSAVGKNKSEKMEYYVHRKVGEGLSGRCVPRSAREGAAAITSCVSPGARRRRGDRAEVIPFVRDRGASAAEGPDAARCRTRPLDRPAGEAISIPSRSACSRISRLSRSRQASSSLVVATRKQACTNSSTPFAPRPTMWISILSGTNRGWASRERPQGIAHRDDLVDRRPVVQRNDGAEAPAGPGGAVVDQGGGHHRVGDRQQRVVERSQPGRAEADALHQPLRTLDRDVLADPEGVLADQEQRPEEVLERILGRERCGQADQAEPGQELRERLTAADEIDLTGGGPNRADSFRPLAAVGTIMSLRLRRSWSRSLRP